MHVSLDTHILITVGAVESIFYGLHEGVVLEVQGIVQFGGLQDGDLSSGKTARDSIVTTPTPPLKRCVGLWNVGTENIG